MIRALRLRAASPSALDRAVAVWQARTTRQLTEEDGREIAHNLVGFFSLLREWDAAQRQAADDRAAEGRVP